MKTELESKFDELNMKYLEKFGSFYPAFITGRFTFEDAIPKIENALKTGKPVTISVDKDKDY